MDTILAARRAGPTGRIIALDFLPSMLERTAAAAAAARLENVETLAGEMEAIPLPDDTVDHVISNAVISLSPRKARTLAECARVLRPDGKLCVADFTVEEEELTTEVVTSRSLGRLNRRGPDGACLRPQPREGRLRDHPDPRSPTTQHRGLRALPTLHRRAARPHAHASPTPPAGPRRDRDRRKARLDARHDHKPTELHPTA